jgi:hypothetical protein
MRAVNLIPSDDRRGVGGVGVGRSQGAAYAVLGLLAGLAALALVYGLARHQISTRRAELASITARAQRAQASASVLAPYTSFIALREARVQAVEQLVDSRFDWAHALHELGRVMPSDASITSFVGSVGTGTPGGGSASSAGGSSAAKSSSASTSGTSASTSGTVSSATPPGSIPTFTLGGCATSQAEVAVTLQRLRLIDGVSNVTLQSSTNSGGAGASTSSCGGGPAFTVQLTFDPLPSVPSTGKSGAELTSSTGGER